MEEKIVFHRREELHWDQIEGQTVVVDDAEGKVYRFNGVAGFVWQNLDGKNLQELRSLVLEEFDAPPKKIFRDVEKFIHKLLSMDLIIKDSHELLSA